MELFTQLMSALGPEAVLGPEDVARRARNFWDSGPMIVRALVRPGSVAELSQAMRICHGAGQPMVIHGGLTGVCGGDLTTGNDVVISLERLARVEEIDVIGRTVVVQAGCTLQALQEAVAAEGLLLPLDLGARGSCTIGGNVATNAGGNNVIRFGMARAQVLGLEAVLADGTIVSSLNRMIKNNAGYDIKQLFIGSEGTLGVVTRVVLALREQLTSANTALCALADEAQLTATLRAADRLLGGTMTAFEAMWNDYFAGVTAPGWHASPMDRGHPMYVLIEARGSNVDGDEARFTQAIGQLLASGLVVDAVLPKSVTERERLWAIREDFEALRQHEPLFLYDVSVPMRDIQAYVAGVREGVRSAWPSGRCYTMGHIGDGNVHFFIHPGEASEAVAALHEQSDRIVYGPLPQYGGSVSAEHGIGLHKKRWLPVSRSASELAVMRAVKRALDPANLLNPGRVFDIAG
jgi:FAD/FMN-containing dehydrogenase